MRSRGIRHDVCDARLECQNLSAQLVTFHGSKITCTAPSTSLFLNAPTSAFMVVDEFFYLLGNIALSADDDTAFGLPAGCKDERTAKQVGRYVWKKSRAEGTGETTNDR